MPGCARLIRGSNHAQSIVCSSKFAFVTICSRPPFLRFSRSLIKDFVVNISHIPHKCNVITQLQQPSSDHIKSNCRPQMSHMRSALNGRAAHIHADLACLHGPEIRNRMRRRIIQSQTRSGFSKPGFARIQSGADAQTLNRACFNSIIFGCGFSCHTAKITEFCRHMHFPRRRVE